MKHYTVDKHISSFTSIADVVIPYDLLRFGNSDSIVDAISTLLGKTLTLSELGLINESISQYTKSQNLSMLRDPKQYYLDTKNTVYPLLNE